MQAPGTRLSYFVEGMDCASCVARVEKMVGTLPGTGEVRTSFARQTLSLALDEAQTSRAALEKNLRSLGYGPTLLPQPGAPVAASDSSHTEHAHQTRQHAGHVHGPADRGKPWYRTGQGQLVVGTGVLLALAWVLGLTVPQWAPWGFTAAALIGVWPLAKKAWASLRLGDPFSINLLVTLAAVGAVAIGEAAEGAVVVFLFAVGELLEGVAAGRARAGIESLAALTPKTALLVEPGAVREVPAADLQVGQTVQVGPGARVPADGTITAGHSSLDDSPVTGESVPVGKGPGDHVYAGSINTDGLLTVRVDRAAADNTIARIIHLVEEAEGSKAPTARFIDRFSRAYTPGVVAAAALTAALPPLLLGQPWFPWLYKGIALLLIGCPCALVLSVPAAITSGISAGTRRGLLIKGGAALEAIGSVRTIAFDKTGTLTQGRPQVTDLVPADPHDDPQELLRLAAAVETGSSHPLAQAITAEAQTRGLSVPAASEVRALPGQGVTAQVGGRAVQVTSPVFAAAQGPLSTEQQRLISTLEAEGRTVVVVLDGGHPRGLIALRDEPREDARDALAGLRRLGVRPLMLTGDNARTGQAVAADLGLDVQAGLLPEDKLHVIEELRVQGGVAMVGDGINDAPALARADVGIAMGSGTDVALETADAALLRGQVQGVAELVQLSRDTLANVRQNVAFALGLKALFLVTTLLGYTNLWMAVLADTGATALVTANALRLLRWRPRSE